MERGEQWTAAKKYCLGHSQQEQKGSESTAHQTPPLQTLCMCRAQTTPLQTLCMCRIWKGTKDFWVPY